MMIKSKLLLLSFVLLSIWLTLQIGVEGKTYHLPVYPSLKEVKVEEGSFSSHNSKYVKSKDEPGMYSIKMNGDPIEIRSYVWVAGLKQEVVVDSGSIVLIVPSVACHNCIQPKPYYKPSPDVEFISCNSSLCATKSNFCPTTKLHPNGICGIQIHYLDSTMVNAYLVKDHFRMTEDMDDIPLIFGSIFNQGGGHDLKFGIMGMGNTCSKCTQTPIDTVFAKNNITKTFGLWLDQEYSGVLTIGDIDTTYTKGSLHYTPLLAIDTIHYGVFPSYAKIVSKEGNGLILTSKDIGITILDTGSSYTLLASDAFNAIKLFLSENCSFPGVCSQQSIFDGYCMNFADEFIDLFPTIYFGLLGDARLIISPRTYITTIYQNGIRFHCLGIKESPLESRSIIGLSWLRNSYVIFDKEHNRIGFGSQNDDGHDQSVHQDLTSSTSSSTTSSSEDIDQCKIMVTQSMKSQYQSDEDVVTDWTFTLSNMDTKETIKGIKLVWTNNLVSLELGYDYQTHLTEPSIEIPPLAHFSFKYSSKGSEPAFVGFPDIPECNQQNFTASKYIIKDNKAQENEMMNLQKYLNGLEQQKPRQDQLPLDKNQQIVGDLIMNPEMIGQKVKKPDPTFTQDGAWNNILLDQQKEELQEEDKESLIPDSHSPNASKKNILLNRCPFEYNQRKGYEWRGSDGVQYTFWDVDILNKSKFNITTIILGTTDDMTYLVGMDKSIENNSVIITLPKNVTILAGTDYKWLYATRNTDAISFSLISTGSCNT